MPEQITSRENAIETIAGAFATFSEILGGKPNFYGSQYNELDALIFGHVAAIMEDPYFSRILAPFITKNEGLYENYRLISGKYYTGITDAQYF